MQVHLHAACHEIFSDSTGQMVNKVKKMTRSQMGQSQPEGARYNMRILYT